MIFVGFLISFGLSCMLFSCEGQVYPPSNQNMIIVLPGSTSRLKWTFEGDLSRAALTWVFTRRRDGSKEEEIAIKFRNNPAIISNSSLSEVAFEPPATLVLKNVDERYNGKYRFIVQVIGGGGEAEVELYIAEKPIGKINCSLPRPIKVNEGDNFTCVCRGEGGNPPTDVTWFKNGTQFGETRKENNTLTRTNVDESDNVTYTCLAQSYPHPMFEDWEPVIVQVKVKPKQTTIAFTQNPANFGTSVVINCESRGFPEPSYTITLNGTKTVSTDKTHTIHEVGWNDTGTYNCTATNERGSDWAAKFLSATEQGPTTPPATTTSKTSNKITTTNEKSIGSASLNDTSSGTKWYIVVVVLVSGIIIGLFLAYIVWCSRRRWFRNRKPERNPEPQTTEADTTYQELDLSKMNAEDNYQSLRVNAAYIDAGNDDESTYTELKKDGRDDENNYQSLT